MGQLQAEQWQPGDTQAAGAGTETDYSLHDHQGLQGPAIHTVYSTGLRVSSFLLLAFWSLSGGRTVKRRRKGNVNQSIPKPILGKWSVADKWAPVLH